VGNSAGSRPDDLIRPEQEPRGNREAEGLGGGEIDHQLERSMTFHGQVGGLGAFRDVVNVAGRKPDKVG
jgi:hypothetical protein